MTDNQEETQGQARKEVIQAKLLRDVIDVLKGNREALCDLPEMLEQLIEMPETIPRVEKAKDTLGECRSEEDKVILARREKEDLDKRVKFLLKDNDVKAERIITLEKTIEEHKAEILALRNTQSASMSKDERLLEKDKNLQKLTNTLQDRHVIYYYFRVTGCLLGNIIYLCSICPHITILQSTFDISNSR
ncbi:uncharacterized protein LOC110065149 [Orbicella faveolata]|uniref:uncharacterized protein LOC110065149 n=1 Tax=Orbicella faveolata TaxID=48498 RepID=UPI0009E42D49|nr:uncharacterized protein LOC110065149 [Orbicella faveolata]